MSWPVRVGRVIVAAEAVGLAIVAALVLLAVGRCQGEREQRDAATIAAAHRLADAYRAERKARALEQASAKVETVTVRVTRQGARVDTVLAGVDSVLADSAATVPILRDRLRLVATEVTTYRVTVDSLLGAHAAYRMLAERRLALADSTITAQAKAIRALRCRAGPFPCPRRTTVGVLALGVGLILGAAR